MYSRALQWGGLGWDGVLTCFCRLANKYFLKVADLSALEGDYHKAIDLFERVARSSINNRLMRYSVNEYFLKAGICHMATRVGV